MDFKKIIMYGLSCFAICCLLLFNVGGGFDIKKAYAQFTGPIGPPYTLNFFNINTPATVMEGQNFTLTGTLGSSSLNTLDNVYLSVQSSSQLLIYGQKTSSMGFFVNGNTQKNFSFKFMPLQPGPIQIFLSATGIQNNVPVVTGNTTVTVTAIATINSTQPSSQMAFTNVSVPPNITVGKTFEIQYGIVNKGSSRANNLFVETQVPNGMLIKDSTVTSINYLSPTKSFTSSVKLVANQAGSYPISLTVFSSNYPPITLPVTVTVGDTSLRLSVTSVGTAPSYIYPGDSNDKITVGLTNYGQSDVQGLVTKLVMPPGITPYSSGADTYSIPLLPSAQIFPTTGQQTENFFINIDQKALPGIYTITMLNNDNHYNNYTTNFPIMVLPKADFELDSVSYTTTDIFGNPENLDSIYPGKTITIGFALKNTGTSRANNLSVQFQTTHDFVTWYGSSQSTGNVDTVGTVNQGQTFTSDFYTTLSPTLSQGKYQGTLLITWQQGDLPGSFTKSVAIPIEVTATPLVYKIPYLEIFLVGIGAIFFILYLLSRRKHKLESRTPI